jgi:predicted Ser/Thr protein kinase
MADESTRISGPPSPPPVDSDRTRLAPSPAAADRVTASSFTQRSGRARTADLEAGDVLGHTYRIEAFLAKGGMGAVYRARHTILETTHAIKVILAQLADDPQVVALLSQEAKALSRVKNDAIVEYQGLFLDEFGRRYLVMEFVDGRSLARVLEQRRFDPGEIRALRDRLAQGLAAAHDKGVFHRDLSPDNIILPGDRVDSAKIIDFGIAKHADAGEKTLIGGDFAGKLSFASPEQAGMYGGKVDGRADIYSLGLVLASCAIGFGGKLAMGDSPATMYQARQSVPDLAQLPPELRDELAAMLQPKPEDRPQHMRELVGWTAGLRAAAKPPASGARSVEAAAPGRKRERRLAPLVAAVGAGLGVALVLAALLHVLLPQILLSRFGIDPVAVQAQLQRQFAQLRCASLSAVVSEDYLFRVKVTLSGVVASEEDARRATELARLGNKAAVTAPLEVLPWPLCEAATLVRAIAARANASPPRLGANQPDFIFHDGDRLVLNVGQTPRFDGYLYVDYIDPDGDVLHMLPAPRQPNNAVAAGQEIVIGLAAGETSAQGQIFNIEPPFGKQVILAVAASQPLFPAPRPRGEKAAPYFDALRKSLEAAGASGDVAATYRIMQIQPKG